MAQNVIAFPTSDTAVASSTRTPPMVLGAGMTMVAAPVVSGTGYGAVEFSVDDAAAAGNTSARWFSHPRGPIARTGWQFTSRVPLLIRVAGVGGAVTIRARNATATEMAGDQLFAAPEGQLLDTNRQRTYALKYSFGNTNTTTIIPPATYTAAGSISCTTSGGSLIMSATAQANANRGVGGIWDSANAEFDLFSDTVNFGLWRYQERLRVLWYPTSQTGVTGKYFGIGLNSYLGEAATAAAPPADGVTATTAGTVGDQSWAHLRAHLSATPEFQLAAFNAVVQDGSDTIKVVSCTNDAVAAPAPNGQHMYHLELVHRPNESVSAYINSALGAAIVDEAHVPSRTAGVRAYPWEMFMATAASTTGSCHWHSLEYEVKYQPLGIL